MQKPEETNVNQQVTHPGGRGAWGTGFNGLGPEPPDIVRGIINPDAVPSDVFEFVFVGGREPILEPSLSEVAEGEPLTDAVKDLGKIGKQSFKKFKFRIKF